MQWIPLKLAKKKLCEKEFPEISEEILMNEAKATAPNIFWSSKLVDHK